MPQELPYLPSYKNVGLLFEKIRSAKIPEAFTSIYLYDTLGLKSKADRPLITMLKALGFVDSANKPTDRYAALKNEKVAGLEIARGTRAAYEPLFSANEEANKLEGQDLRGLVAQVAGSDTNTTSKIVGTFKSLVALGDWDTKSAQEEKAERPDTPDDNQKDEENTHNGEEKGKTLAFQSMRPEFHYNIQVHLPSNGTEETYMNIFNAVRKVFK